MSSALLKQDLALNNLQRLICHKTQPNNPMPPRTAFRLLLCYEISKVFG